MSGESSEEKTLPPSQHKLRKAREKGQVVTSRETLSSVTTAVVLVWLFLRRDSIAADLRVLLTAEPDPAAGFAVALAGQARLALRLGVGVIGPILLGVIVVAVLGGVTISGGPVFSTQPLTPDFDRLNPASAFKRLFGRKALIGFLMHVLRLCALLVAPALVIRASLGGLIEAPSCGLACAGGAMTAMLVPVLVAVLAILVLAGLLDYMVQRAGFMREQRMSITEFKRELKEQDGNPQLRGRLRQDQRMMVERPTGLAQATSVIHAGASAAVGLRYVEGETPAPLVVIRARGPEAVARLLRAARGIRISEDGAAVGAVAQVPVGEYVVEDAQIQAIAPFLRPL
jgi:type III secretion protein U